MRRRYDGQTRDEQLVPRLAPMKPTSTLLYAAGSASSRFTQADEMRVLLINRIAEEFGKDLKQTRRRKLADFVIDKAFEAIPPGGSIGKDTVGQLEMQAREKANQLLKLPPSPPRTLEGALSRGRSEREERKVIELRKERKKAIKAIETVGTSAPPSLVRLRLEIFEAARRRAKEVAQAAAAQAASDEEELRQKKFELPKSIIVQDESSRTAVGPPLPPSIHQKVDLDQLSASNSAARAKRLNIALREAESTLKMRSEALRLASSAAVTKKAEWLYASEERERQIQLAPSRKANDARQRIRSASLLQEEAHVKQQKANAHLEQAKIDCMRAQEQFDMINNLINRDTLAKEAEITRKNQADTETQKRREQMGLTRPNKPLITNSAHARRLRTLSAPPPLPGPNGTRPEREIEATKKDDLMRALKAGADYFDRRADAVERQAVSDSWRSSIHETSNWTSNNMMSSDDNIIEHLGVNVDAGESGDEYLIPLDMEMQRRSRATAAASFAINALLPLPRNLRPRTNSAHEAALCEAASERVKEMNKKARAKDQAIKDYVKASRESQRVGGMAPDATSVMMAVDGIIVPPVLPPHKPSRRIVQLEKLLAEQKAQDDKTFFQYRGDFQYAQENEEMAVEGLSLEPAGAPSFVVDNSTHSSTRPRRSSASGARYSKWFNSGSIFDILDLEGIRKETSKQQQQQQQQHQHQEQQNEEDHVIETSKDFDLKPSVEFIYETARASLQSKAVAPPAPPAPPPPPPLPSSKPVSKSSVHTQSEIRTRDIPFESVSVQAKVSQDDKRIFETRKTYLPPQPPPVPMQVIPAPRMTSINKNEWQTAEDAADSAAATEALVKGVKLKKKPSSLTLSGHNRNEIIEGLLSRPSALGISRKAGSKTSSYRSFGATSIVNIPQERKKKKVAIKMVENTSLAIHQGLKPLPTPKPLAFSPVDHLNRIVEIKPLLSETLISLAKPRTISHPHPPPSIKTPFHTL